MSEDTKPAPGEQEISTEDLEQVTGGFSWGATNQQGPVAVVQKVVGGISPGAIKSGDGSV